MNRTSLGTTAWTLIASIAALTTIGPFAARAAFTGGAPGGQRRWTLEFRVRLEQPGSGRPIEINLSGEWVSTICAVRPGEYDAVLQLADARIQGESSGSAQAREVEPVQHRLTRPFWATYSEDGALLAVHFYKDVDPGDRNLLQMIAAGIQLVRPSLSRPVWTVLERDGAGSYLAIYQRPESTVVVKRKLKYVDTDGAPGVAVGGVKVAVDQSELRFTLDADGGIAALEGTDRARMGISLAGAGDLTAHTEIRLTNLRTTHAPELIGSLAHSLHGVESSPVVTHKPDPAQTQALHDGRLLEGRTSESLLEEAMAKGGDPQLPDRLAALFRRRPEAIAAAVSLVRKSGGQKRITQALASAGTPTAIDALGGLAGDGAPDPSRVEALAAFVALQHPSLEAMRIPAGLLDDTGAQVAAAARIVSGALARAGRAEHPTQAAALDTALVARYRTAKDAGELTDLLSALGNSASAAVAPLIEEALRDSRSRLRASAVHALRLVEGPEVERLIGAAITSDSDPDVRAAAIFAVGFRRPLGVSLCEALLRAARTDPVEYVRSNAITLLRQNPGASPKVATTLAAIAEHDAKPGVRRLAQEALAFISPQR